MIVAVKVYFEVDARLNAEQTKVVVDYLQQRVTADVRAKHPFRYGYHFSINDAKVITKILDWDEVQKQLRIQVDDITTAPKKERKTTKQKQEDKD